MRPILPFGTRSIRDVVSFHGSLPTMPRGSISGGFSHNSDITSLADQFAVMAQGQFWIGTVLGLLFLAAAVWVRKHRNQI